VTSTAESPFRAQVERVVAARDAVSSVVVGQDAIVEQLFIALLAGGHVLIEGAPGLGKTLLVRTMATVCGLEFSRIQFTPDLMPSDITGSVVLVHDDAGVTHPQFRRGPIFAQLVLTDEINRSTPKTQSALLEAMQEGTVTVAGVEHVLPIPFVVLATQNPIEMEGTYQLPEAQTDRFFFKVQIPYPDHAVLGAILDLTTGASVGVPEAILSPADLLDLQSIVREVALPTAVRDGIVRFLLESQPQRSESSDEVRRFVRFGVSPRGGQTLVLAAKARAFLEGRFNVGFQDVREVALPALRHRFRLNYDAEAEGLTTDMMLTELVERHVR